MKKILHISALGALLFAGISTTHAQVTLWNNWTTTINDKEITGWNNEVCTGQAGSHSRAICKFPNADWQNDPSNYVNTLFQIINNYEKGKKIYSNWVLNANVDNKLQTQDGLSFLTELPGKHTAITSVTIDNFQKEDEYTLEFDLIGVYSGIGNLQRPFLQIELGEYKPYEKNDAVEWLGTPEKLPVRFGSQPKYDDTFWNTYLTKNPTNSVIERNNLINYFKNTYLGTHPTGNAFLLKPELTTDGTKTTVRIKTHGKNICGNCADNQPATINLKLSGILVNNWWVDDKKMGRFMGNDFVIKNFSLSQAKDVTPPADPTIGKWKNEKWEEVTHVKNGDKVTIELTNVEKDATVTIPWTTCKPAPATATKTVVCEAIVGESGFDGTEQIATIKDPSGNENTNLKSNPLTLDNDLPEIDFTEMNFNNGVTNPVKVMGGEKNEVTITLGNGVEFDNFLAKIKDQTDGESNFSVVTDITFKGEKLTEKDLKLSETGTYEITFTAKDTAGNTVTKALKITITKNNTEELEKEIAKKTVTNEDKYNFDNETDKKNYIDALTKANEIIEKQKKHSNVLQKDIDEALENLKNAYTKLDGKRPQNNSGNTGSGPGGYVALTPVKETTPTKPITTADNQNIFKTGNIGGQCVSIVKNLDEPRLVDYYTSTLNINSSREVHTDVSRGEFMKMLFLASGLDISNIAIRTDIADVDTNNPYARYISAGLHYGLVHGQTDGTHLYFRPSDSLSRAEAAKIFIRAANLSTSTFSGIFSDVSASLTLSEYIESAYNNCLLHGRKTLNGQPMNGKPRVFEPYSPITIAETAKVLYNMTH